MSYVIVCKRESPARYLFLSNRGKLIPWFDSKGSGWKRFANVFATKEEASIKLAEIEKAKQFVTSLETLFGLRLFNDTLQDTDTFGIMELENETA